MCGSSSPAPSSSSTSVAELPDWAKPYAKESLAKAAALTDIGKNPYQTYGGERIAGFQPLQEQAFKSAAGMDAGPAGFQAGIGQYMSPYMQNVVDVEKREAARQSGIMGTQQQAQATQAGAFGGGRDALMRAERERNLATQMGDIQARGSQAAYEQAANQFRQGIQQQGALAQLQAGFGGQQQQQAQRPLDVAYQDFINQQNYPYKQLGYMSDIIRGLPLGQKSTSTMYEAPGSVLGQLGGLGMGAYGMSKLFAKDGGLMSSYADGGMAEGSMIAENEPVVRYADGGVTNVNNVEAILSKLSDQQLQQAKEAALNRRDIQEAQMIDAEIAQRAQARQGIAPAVSEGFANDMEQSMATGGIVAFANGDVVQDPNELTSSDYNLPSLSQILDYFTPKAALENRQAYERKVAEAEKSKPAPAAPSAPAAKADVPVINVAPPAAKPSGKPAAPSGSISGALPTKSQVKSAVDQFADQNKLDPSTKDTLMDTALKIKEEFAKSNQPILDELRKSIEEQKPDAAAMREKGLAQALTTFGFNMAQQASKRGREGYGEGIGGALASAAAASPVIADVAAKTDQLIQNRQDNYAKLKMDQAKYEVALAKGDMQTASALAGQIRQSDQFDKQLGFQIAHARDLMTLEREKMAQQAAYQKQMMSKYETVGSLTRDIMQNEGLSYDKAIEKAGNILKGGIPASIRGETSLMINRQKAVEKANASPAGQFLAMTKPTDPNYPARKKAYEDQVARELALLSPSGVDSGIAGALPTQSALPSGVTVTQIGQ